MHMTALCATVILGFNSIESNSRAKNTLQMDLDGLLAILLWYKVGHSFY